MKNTVIALILVRVGILIAFPLFSMTEPFYVSTLAVMLFVMEMVGEKKDFIIINSAAHHHFIFK
jgi:hypothetical protein